MNDDSSTFWTAPAGRPDETIARDEAHRTGTWHGAFHCLILYAREGTGYALFQQRSSEKLIAPGAFDMSVGGHYAAGEGAETGRGRSGKSSVLTSAFATCCPWAAGCSCTALPR